MDVTFTFPNLNHLERQMASLILPVFVGVSRADNDVVPAGLDHPAREGPPEIAASDDGDGLAVGGGGGPVGGVVADVDRDAVVGPAAAAARLFRAAAANAPRLASATEQEKGVYAIYRTSWKATEISSFMSRRKINWKEPFGGVKNS